MVSDNTKSFDSTDANQINVADLLKIDPEIGTVEDSVQKLLHTDSRNSRHDLTFSESQTSRVSRKKRK